MKSITISVFNTLKSNNVVVSGWYQYNDSPTIYDLITGATDKRHEQRVYNKKFMSPLSILLRPTFRESILKSVIVTAADLNTSTITSIGIAASALVGLDRAILAVTR